MDISLKNGLVLMAGKVLDLLDVITPDQLARGICEKYQTWESFRQQKVAEWQEVQKYVFATDTTKTTNSSLPWSNKTTIPKLCQIRDNLFSNYMATMFPKRRNIKWISDTEEDNEKDKKDAIENYINWVTDRNEYYDEVEKVVLDYIDYGNCFATVEWSDRRVQVEESEDSGGKIQSGYVGPQLRRINPLDIVFNPTAPSFGESPKIIRSIVSLGEIKEMLERLSTDANEKEDAQKMWDYIRGIRQTVTQYVGDLSVKDEIYNISGFTSYRNYLESNYVEVLTFYGDIYDDESEEFRRNRVIKIVDRHKVISDNVHPSDFGTAPVFHVGWRIRPDNLWAMGPLDNLVGMQYRIDHLENMKADVFDLIAYPPLMVKGYVDDFTWAPMERIYTSDEGDVKLMSPDVNALQADTQIAILEAKMEEMAGSPKEAMGFRTPGEKTKYEVQRLENAAARIFQNKTGQFERRGPENWLNAMLELARRNMTDQVIRVFDNDYKINVFQSLTQDDITGYGRLKPVAARHFAETAQLVQDLSNFRQSTAGSDPSLLMHFSTVKEAALWEELLEIEKYQIVQPYIRIHEQKDAQMLSNINQEQTAAQTAQPAGITPDDYTAGAENSPEPPAEGAL